MNQIHRLNRTKASVKPAASSATAFSPFDQVDMIGKLADLKEHHYRNTLVLSALIELLVEKGVLQLGEIEAKATELSLT